MTSLLITFVLVLTVVALVELGLDRLDHHKTADKLTEGDRIRIPLEVVGAIAAAVTFTVAYRQQRNSERGKFDSRFAAASAQLGSDTPAQRLAGVYALATLGDENKDRRQQCADLLCAYIRLPYDPNNALLQTVVSEEIHTFASGQVKRQRTSQSVPNNREVRLAIIEVLRRRLQTTAPYKWTNVRLDFTGAVFDGGSFDGSVFTNEIRFDYATFCGDFDLSHVEFRGLVAFSGARFVSHLVSFNGSRFTSGSGIKFVTSSGLKFISGYTAFFEAEIDGGMISFNHVDFFGGRVAFNNAVFKRGLVTFTSSIFWPGSQVIFTEADFNKGCELSFYDVSFYGGEVVLGDKPFSGYYDGWFRPRPYRHSP